MRAALMFLALLPSSLLAAQAPESVHGNWRVMKTTDRMSGAPVLTAESSDMAVIALPTGLKSAPLVLTATEHDFPGRKMRVRIDDGKLYTVAPETSAQILKAMLAGKRLRLEFYRWPYDVPAVVDVDLEGFADAWKAAALGVQSKP